MRGRIYDRRLLWYQVLIFCISFAISWYLRVSFPIHHLDFSRGHSDYVVFSIELVLATVSLRLPRSARRAFLYSAISLHLCQRKSAFDAFHLPSIFTGQRVDMVSVKLQGGATRPLVFSVHTIDVKRCIKLHNELVEYTLDKLGHDKTSLNVRLNWFSFWGEEAESVRDRLSAPMIEFLENTYVWELDRYNNLFMTPDVRGVSRQYDVVPDQDNNALFDEMFANSIELYHNRELDWDGQGLIFDMTRNLVHWYPWKDQFPGEDDVWVPLETALEYYWSEIRNGRNFVQPPSADQDEDDAEPPGWRRLPYADVDVDRAVEMWDAYVDLLQSRVPKKPESISGMVIEKLLDAYEVTGFARHVLPRMRDPGARYIAPGLRMFDETLAAVALPVIKSRRLSRHSRDMPSDNFLLFQSDMQIEDQAIAPRYNYSAPDWKARMLLDDRCGIYIGAGYGDVHDTISIVAPKTVNEQERELDRVSPLRETEIHFHEPYGWYSASLLDHEYELVASAVDGARGVQLYQFIALWYDEVKSGKWKVTEHGVEGSIGDHWAVIPYH